MYQRTEQRAVPYLFGILVADGLLWRKRTGKTWELSGVRYVGTVPENRGLAALPWLRPWIEGGDLAVPK